LIAASAAIVLLLGCSHLLYTFRGPNLDPRDAELTAKMMAVSPVITQETTMWRVWVGLNASLGIGLILFGGLYGYLAICHQDFLFHSWFLLGFGFSVLLGYAVVTKLYFFSAPFRGIALAEVLYVLVKFGESGLCEQRGETRSRAARTWRTRQAKVAARQHIEWGELFRMELRNACCSLSAQGLEPGLYDFS
jgi:hypothetical protein